MSSTDANGYYIYRSMSHDGLFELIADIESNAVGAYLDTENVNIMSNFYWYKMSAYKEIDEDEKLEGTRSVPHTWGG